MKKGILLIASAAALVLGSNNAFAAAPNWYNFQGVCLEQNATVTVQFDIVNANGDAIYSEVHSGVQTNASGIFTLHVGQGSALEGAMPSNAELYKGGLVLITNVNGVEVSRAALGAVPYAAHAQAVGEYTADDITKLGDWVGEIAESAGSYDDQIADLWDAVQPLAGIMPEYTKMVQDVALNTEGIANAEQAIAELSPAVKGNTAAIAKLQEDVELNITGIGEAENAILELSPAVKGNTAAIAKLQELQDQLQEYVMEQIGDAGVIPQTITWLNKAIDDIEANYVTTEQLDKDMANFQENIEMALKAYVTTEDLDASMDNFQENIANKFTEVEASIADILNKNENYENAFNEIFENYVTKEDLDDALGSIERNSNLISQLQSKVAEHIDEYQTNIDDLIGTDERLAAQISQLQSKVEEEIKEGIDSAIGNTERNSILITELQARVIALEEALEAK